ncbi:MAG: zinc-regulated TonB-dependent outer membrane receptor [Lentisphaeria bacterium]|jgi:hypothetical protein
MSKLTRRLAFVSLFIAFSALIVPAVRAQDPSPQELAKTLRELSQQIQTLKKEHAAALQAMQQEIDSLKSQLQQQTAQTTPPPSAVSPPAAPVAPAADREEDEQQLYAAIKSSVASMLPAAPVPGMDLDASVIVDGYYHYDDHKHGVSHLKHSMAGFSHAHDDHDAGHGHEHGVIEDGFNLRHIELGLSAAVDPYFTAWTTLAFDDHASEVEEAVIQTSALPWGLTLSAGKIKSGIGRMNRQHSHNWDFFDQPLVYDAFFGDHGLTDKGLQLTWLAPTPCYFLLGVEAFQGKHENVANYLGSDPLPRHNGPRLWTSFLKFGPQLGDQHALQFGLSYVQGRHQEEEEHDGHKHYFNGYNRIYGADVVYKYDAKRPHGHGDVVLQGEFFRRERDVELLNNGKDYDSSQDGYYLQALYGFRPRWRVGARWEQLGVTNDVHDVHDGKLSCGASNRASAMLDWKLSEFSLLRLQATQGNFATAEGRKDFWEFIMQLQISIGKHAAHDF